MAQGPNKMVRGHNKTELKVETLCALASGYGWKQDQDVFSRGEGAVLKQTRIFSTEKTYPIKLFIGPRGSVKTGRSHKSSACMFWGEVPRIDQVTSAYGKKI